MKDVLLIYPRHKLGSRIQKHRQALGFGMTTEDDQAPSINQPTETGEKDEHLSPQVPSMPIRRRCRIGRGN